MYILLLLSIISASMNSIVLNKVNITKTFQVLKLNLYCSFIWCTVFFIFCRGSFSFNPTVILFGIFYGLTQALFLVFKTAAMNSGSVSVTTLIGNSSLFISVFAGTLIWNERLLSTDIIGLVLLGCSIYLCVYKKKSSEYKPVWKFYVLLFFIFAALVGIIFKAFGKTDYSDYCNQMMFVASLVMILCFSIICFVGGRRENNKKTSGNTDVKAFVKASFISGILSCLYNRLNIFLAGNLNAVVFFPVFNGGVLILSTLLGIAICREHLTGKQYAGLILGVFAICLIGIF